jgi:hypothetical protein
MIFRSTKACAAIAAAAVLVVGVAAGTAGARRSHHQGLLLKAAAQYVGVSKADLVKDARAGRTLAQIAAAHGKTVAGLKNAMLAAIEAKLDSAVSAGRLTAAQEQQKLVRAEKIVSRIIEMKLGRVERGARQARLLRVAARYVGVTPKALGSELKASKSLAQVATAHGKTVAGLKEALLEPFRTRLEGAVASNRIAPAEAQIRLGRISSRLDRLINRRG